MLAATYHFLALASNSPHIHQSRFWSSHLTRGETAKWAHLPRSLASSSELPFVRKVDFVFFFCLFHLQFVKNWCSGMAADPSYKSSSVSSGWVGNESQKWTFPTDSTFFRKSSPKKFSYYLPMEIWAKFLGLRGKTVLQSSPKQLKQMLTCLKKKDIEISELLDTRTAQEKLYGSILCFYFSVVVLTTGVVQGNAAMLRNFRNVLWTTTPDFPSALGRINNDWIFNLGWTSPLSISLTDKPTWLYAVCILCLLLASWQQRDDSKREVRGEETNATQVPRGTPSLML